MTNIVDSKTFPPSHQSPTTISEVITSLQRMQSTYGDLPIELFTHTPEGVTAYADIFYSYNTYDDSTANISIQSFPY